jgi:hypothetical protein
MLAPDWQPIVWTEAERKKGQAWGSRPSRVSIPMEHPRSSSTLVRGAKDAGSTKQDPAYDSA